MSNIDMSQIITAEDLKADAMTAMRARRDQLLLESDWSVLPDVSPPGGVTAWKQYRQALRNMPETVEDPAAPVWPPMPMPS
ncbi:hypothetical protein GCM10011415_02000 [Salipiger pallidus]|uniref:Phage tail assembly chaperone-like domain-containing protein n=1 Tax=Salipiger pallidus TaxID=1775170 RepID=A0A8J2ZGB3_9RHOB|nr:phage tail assembly chaperone [Salipiger pallidus]GGG59694.1 hypothetical protein GCM10011415_02000 [Salipiger pallidus]